MVSPETLPTPGPLLAYWFHDNPGSGTVQLPACKNSKLICSVIYTNEIRMSVGHVCSHTTSPQALETAEHVKKSTATCRMLWRWNTCGAHLHVVSETTLLVQGLLTLIHTKETSGCILTQKAPCSHHLINIWASAMISSCTFDLVIIL